jgi:mannose-1-phosphate guanylyltransferase
VTAQLEPNLETLRLTLNRTDLSNHRWGVILAGGDGKRLLPLTRKIAGDHRPKQFCAIVDGETLLDKTRRRVWRMVRPEQTLVVVTKSHERFYADQADGEHSSPLLIQPDNKGTTPAIVYSLMRLRELDHRAVVGFFPSNHYFADDEAFIANVESAFEATEYRLGQVILLGVVPSGPEVDYNWIEPGAPLKIHAAGPVFSVRRFWEKPPLSLAYALMERGCLWNSFVMVGRVDSFLNLIRRASPALSESFEAIRPTILTPMEEASLVDLYSRIPTSSFSDEVLSWHPWELAVLCTKNLGWSDLGETHRVLSVLDRKRAGPEWLFERPDDRNAAG